jgi:hypothetical protein
LTGFKNIGGLAGRLREKGYTILMGFEEAIGMRGGRVVFFFVVVVVVVVAIIFVVSTCISFLPRFSCVSIHQLHAIHSCFLSSHSQAI